MIVNSQNQRYCQKRRKKRQRLLYSTDTRVRLQGEFRSEDESSPPKESTRL